MENWQNIYRAPFRFMDEGNIILDVDNNHALDIYEVYPAETEDSYDRDMIEDFGFFVTNLLNAHAGGVKLAQADEWADHFGLECYTNGVSIYSEEEEVFHIRVRGFGRLHYRPGIPDSVGMNTQIAFTEHVTKLLNDYAAWAAQKNVAVIGSRAVLPFHLYSALAATIGANVPLPPPRPPALLKQCRLPGCWETTSHNRGYCCAEHCRQHKEGIPT